MSKIMETIIVKHSLVEKPISEEYYKKRKNELSKEELEKIYFYRESEFFNTKQYYEKINEVPTEETITALLLDKILEQQTKAAAKLSTISGIMIFSLICGIVAALIVLIP